MRRLFLVMTLAPLVLLAGCDGTADERGSATVRVHLTDFPLELISEANVSIERIELIRQGSGREVLAEFDEPPVFNLMELQNGVTVLVAEEEIPGGTFNQLRVVVGSSAEVVLVEDPNGPGPPQVFSLTVPSGTETGIKINLPQLTIDTEGELVEIVVDFDVSQSFVVQGNPETPAGISGFSFKPVLKLDRLEVNGDVIVE